MPIEKIKKEKNYTYGLWFIKEKSQELLSLLKPESDEKNAIEHIKNTKRRNQNIVARLIINKLARKKVKLNYLNSGAPFCKHFEHISISHSHNYCIAIISHRPIGIDIQYKNPNIELLSRKFVNKKELNNIPKIDKLEKLHFLWCAKEAIYKTIHNQACSFLKDIHIDCNQSTMNTIGYYKKSQKYQINYSSFKDYFIAIATHVS